MFIWIADLAYRRAKLVLVCAAVALVAASVYGADTANRLLAAAYDPEVPTETGRATDRLTEGLGYDPEAQVLVLVDSAGPIRSRGALAEVKSISRQLRSDPSVGHVNDLTGPRGQALVGRDGHSTLILAHLRHGDSIEDTIHTTRRLQGNVDADNVRIRFGGYGPGTVTTTDTARDDLIRAELISFPILLILLLFVFRGVVAALLPFSIGIFSLLGTFALLKGLDHVEPVSIFALNVATALGIGLAIDYSLLMVSRYREELRQRGDPHDALRAMLDHAGRAVVYSGLIVAAAMATLVIFPQRLIYSMGLGGAVVAVLAVLAALLIVPAMLALLGERVNALSLSRKPAADERSGFWYRLSQFVMRRPGRVALTSSIVLVAFALPVLGMKVSGMYPAYLPDSNPVKQAEVKRATDYPQLGRSTINIAVEAPATAKGNRALATYAARIERLPDVASVDRPQRLRNGTVLLTVASRRSPYNDSSPRLVRRIRALPLQYSALVGGQTAKFVDYKTEIAKRIPYAIALIAIAMFVLIFLMTGSVLLPIKTMIMNALSLSATFGILVLIFQDAHLEGLLDYRSAGGIDVAIAPLVLAAGFGLCTDYGVFLLARIREEHDQGAPDPEAISTGMQRTGRVISAAAVLLCVALGVLVTSGILFIKETGLGLALAVAIDATIVRALLVPSLMQLMGRWNWWAPAPLARLHSRFARSRFGESGATAAPRQPAPATPRT